MSAPEAERTSPPALPEIDGGLACHAKGIYQDVMGLVAKYASIAPEDLRGVLFRLAEQPAEPWAEDSAEAYVLRFITLTQLPPLLTLIDDWAPTLNYTPTDTNAVLEGVHPAVILPTVALPEGLDRDEVLIKAWDGGWGVEQTQAAVRAMWITMELPQDLLAALDALNAALADPALIHGSTQYFALRREVFELERRCAAVIEEQDHAEWVLRYQTED